MTDRYPGSPGSKGPDGTSQAAAQTIAPDVSFLRRAALKALGKLGEATVLEAVVVAGVTRESLQPRFSELRAMGLVEPTGARLRNPSVKHAAVLRLTGQGKALFRTSAASSKVNLADLALSRSAVRNSQLGRGSHA